MKTFRNISFFLAVGVLCFTWGCSSLPYAGLHTGPVNHNWGESFESAKYYQILHPEAGGIQPVEDLHGQNADKVYKRYQNMFKGEAEALQTSTTNVQ